MIVDTSAVVAMMLGEPERAEFSELIRAAAVAGLAAPNYVELALVLDSRGPAIGRELDRVLADHRIRIVSFDPAQARAARLAHRLYGRGSGSRARLNFGDCLAYAAAIVLDEPLLFKGDDFTHTDVRDARAEVAR